jgi:hypothetical protein
MIVWSEQNTNGETEMKNYKVTVSAVGTFDSLTYEVRKTLKGAEGFARRVAKEAFWGEEVKIEIVEIQ